MDNVLRCKFVFDALQRAKIVDDDKFIIAVWVNKEWCDRGEEKTLIELDLV